MPLIKKKSSSAVGRWGKKDPDGAAETSKSSSKVQARKSSSPVPVVSSSKQLASPQMRSPTQKLQREPQQTQSRQPPPGMSNPLVQPTSQKTSAPLGLEVFPQAQGESPSTEMPKSVPATRPPLQPQSKQTPDIDQLRLLAYQQRQQERRRNRAITPNMLKARPVEIKHNVVMRSKHKSSEGSVTSETSYRSDITEKATNLKAYRKKRRDFEILETLESKETFESLKNDAENRMAMANAMLDEALEAKRKAQLEIAEEKKRLQAAAEAHEQAQKDEEELQRVLNAHAAKERKHYEAIEQQLAAVAEEKRQTQEEAQQRIAMLEANQIRLDKEHKAALEEARNQARIEMQRLQQEEMQEKQRIASLQEEEESQNLEAEEKHQAQEKAEERIRIMEFEQKRLDKEHKVALAEAQKQAKIAAEEEKRRVEVQQQKQLLEEQLRIEIARHNEIAESTRKTFLHISATEAEEKRKAQAEAAERIAILESGQRLLDEEHKAALAEAQRLAKIAADEEKSRLEVDQRRMQLEEQLRIEIERHAKFATEEKEWRKKATETRTKLEEEAHRQAQIAAEEGTKRLEVENRRLELEAEIQKHAQIAIEEGKKRLEAEQKRIALEARLFEVEKEKRAVEKESRKWYDLRNLGSWQHAPDTAMSVKTESRQGDTNLSQAVGTRESKNLGTIEDSWTSLGDKSATKAKKGKLIGSTSFDVSKLGMRQVVSRETPTVHSTPLMSSSSKRNETQSSAALSALKLLVSETIRELALELAAEQGRDLLAVESEDLKLLDQECRQVEEKIEATLSEYRQASEDVEEENHPVNNIKEKKTFSKSLRKDKIKEGNGTSRLDELELELVELCKVIAEKKEEAARLLNDSSYNVAIQRGAGRASKEKDQLEYPTQSPGRENEYQMEEGIEVMPTLSDTEVISVNTPVSIDESAFAQNPTLSHKSGRPLFEMKQKDDIRGAGNVSNVPPIATSTSRDRYGSAYDEDVAALVPTAKESTAFEDDANELIPGTFMIPERREAAIETSAYQAASPPMEHPPRMVYPVMSPRVNNSRSTLPPKKKESFFERAAHLSDKACLGGRRAAFACVDTCQSPSKQFNENGDLEQERPGMEMKYYDPLSPPSRSILRNAEPNYLQEEEDLVTRAFVTAMHRVEGEHHAREDDEDREHLARRKPRKQVRYGDIMSVDGRFVTASKHARERRDREQVPRNLEITPRARTPRGGHQQAWRDEVTSPRGDRWGEDVASPQQQWGEEVPRPREDREELPKPIKKKGLGNKMLKGMKKLAKARIVYDD